MVKFADSIKKLLLNFLNKTVVKTDGIKVILSNYLNNINILYNVRIYTPYTLYIFSQKPHTQNFFTKLKKRKTDVSNSTEKINKILTEIWKDEETIDDEQAYVVWSIRFKEFLENVSIIGVRYIVEKGISKTRKIFWFFLVLFGLAFMCFQLQERIQYYIKSDRTTRITFNHNNELRFPTTTICNENRMTLKNCHSFGKVKIPKYSITVFIKKKNYQFI